MKTGSTIQLFLILTLLWSCDVENPIPDPIENPEYANWIIPKNEIITIGRKGHGAHVEIDSRLASRRHAQIEARMDGIYIMDLESSNGTMVGQQPITPNTWVKILPDDVFTIASQKLKVAAEGQKEKAPKSSEPQKEFKGFKQKIVSKGAYKIGRLENNDIVLDDPTVTREHAIISYSQGEFWIEDLGSTNGTLVNGTKLTAPRALQDGDQIQVGVNMLLKFSLQDEAQARFQQELYEAALRDPLTNAYNRRVFVERLEQDLSHAERHGEQLSLLLFDLDHFKSVNDTYGHLAGDKVLVEFSELVLEGVRREDLFARYGGEEFAMACRSTTLVAAAGLAERIRDGVASRRFEFDGQLIPVSVSIGVATVRAEDTVESLIDRADKALYRAKRDGRNRVVTEGT